MTANPTQRNSALREPPTSAWSWACTRILITKHSMPGPGDMLKDQDASTPAKYVGASWTAKDETSWANHYMIFEDMKEKDVAKNWKNGQ